MEYKVERFQLSPFFTVSTLPRNGDQQPVYKSSMPTTTVVHQTVPAKDKRNNKDDIALNLSPDGSQLSISINGTTVNVTKTSFNATIGDFSIIIKCPDRDLPKLLPAQDMPTLSTILVISISKNNPLQVVLGDTSYVTSNITLVEGINDPNVHYITLISNGQGLHYMSAKNNAYYAGIDSNYNIQVESESEFDNADMYTFKQEDVNDDAVRYYLERGGNKYYLMVASDGNLTTLNANDLVLGSQNDTLSRFRIEQI